LAHILKEIYVRQSLLLALFFITAIFFASSAHAQFSTKPEPMWEGYEKTSSDIESDKKFVEDTLKLSDGDREKAAATLIQIGWQRIGSDANHAIRAFNQAWLVDPDNPGIFWGFAVATHLRNDELPVVIRWFDKTRELFKKQGFAENARLEANQGRVLVERDMPAQALPFFEKALVIEPQYIQAHLAIIEIARQTENTALQTKHEVLLKAKSGQKSE